MSTTVEQREKTLVTGPSELLCENATPVLEKSGNEAALTTRHAAAESAIVKTFDHSVPATYDRPAQKIAVIGAGVAGVATAIKLAEQNYMVYLIDAGGVMAGTSNMTPGRLGLGFHYAHRATAEMMLDATLDFVTRYPGSTLSCQLPPDHPLRRAQYFVAKDSLFHPRISHRCTTLWWNGTQESGLARMVCCPSATLRLPAQDGFA